MMPAVSFPATPRRTHDAQILEHRGLVLVTGGSRRRRVLYRWLLNNGWRVRSTGARAKVKAVRASISNIGSNASEIEFVEADSTGRGWTATGGGSTFCTSRLSP
jgi:hypothetical protein